MYEKTFVAGWADMDFNSHMKNTAFLDKSADTRMMYFAANGFPMSQFVALEIGPVIMKDEVEYSREVGLLETVNVTLAVAALANDGSRWMMRNEIFRADGKLAARVTSTGGWLSLRSRRLVAPPEALLGALSALERTADFQTLASSLR
ncbi:MAG: thioesterase family protein [Candidatus Schekmanbacteria bacterium]|nr:thioesterase family protein [Candidatus Schekmanbacteria bacterium]